MAHDEGARADWLLYGAYGFTGRLIAKAAVAAGLAPVLAGRDPVRTRRLAARLELPFRAFSLDDPAELLRGIADVDLVVHAAGPFVHTWRPMVEACLAGGCDYVDITGEIEALEGVFSLSAAARSKGVVLLPGAGFDVVPTDCAATRVAARIDHPTRLDLAFVATGRPSAGSLRGILEGLTRNGAIRQDGAIVPVPHGTIRRTIPFTDRPREAVAIPWGDVSTAWYSTGIPDIRVFTPIGPGQLRWMRAARRLFRNAAARRWADGLLRRFGGAPGERELREGMGRIWAEVRNEHGETAAVELTVSNGYTFTADSVVETVRLLTASDRRDRPGGALTPSMAFGHEFVDRLPGVRWTQV